MHTAKVCSLVMVLTGEHVKYCTVTTSAGDSVRKNRMELSFELFNQTCTNRLTSRIPVALCFSRSCFTYIIYPKD